MNFLRVDMGSLTCKYEDNHDYTGLAGRALTSKIVSNEVPANGHPLGKENKLIVAPGFLTGTNAPCTGRCSVGGKSPLTRGIKESNAGGVSGQKLARLGIDAVIVEGMPQTEGSFYILHISKAGAELLSANGLKGLGNKDTVARLSKTYGSKVGYLTIGQAGEMRFLTGSIASTDPENIPTRGARRGGLGAVMGSKGLKAIIVDDGGSGPVQAKDKEQFIKYVRAAVKAIQDNPLTGQALPALGTTCLTLMVNAAGALPTQNFRRGTFESAEKVSGEAMLGLITSRGESGRKNRPCSYGCPVSCSRYWLDEAGKRAGKRPEYEVLWAHSANLLIDDLEAIVEMCELEDNYGVDGMDSGMALAMLMEAGVIDWGDAKKCVEIVKEIGKGTPLGRIIGSGAVVTGQVFGIDRVSCSKRQALSGYDPRISKCMGVTYATNPMGSDNTSGFCFFNKPEEDKPEDWAQFSFNAQIETAAFDSVGLCGLVGFHVSEEFPKYILGMINLRYGTDFKDLADLLKIGRDTLQTEFEYNNKCGISINDNRLPYFFYHEEIGDRGTKFDIPDSVMDKLYIELAGGKE